MMLRHEWGTRFIVVDSELVKCKSPALTPGFCDVFNFSGLSENALPLWWRIFCGCKWLLDWVLWFLPVRKSWIGSLTTICAIVALADCTHTAMGLRA